MSEEPTTIPEHQLAEIAGAFSYPPTPDVAGRVRQRLAQRRRRPHPGRPAARRRLAWALLLLLMLAGVLLTVPTVRAALREFFQIGAIRILPEPGLSGAASPTPAANATASRSLLDLAGATSWDEAQAQTAFTLRYPPALGPPDEVYRQQLWDPGSDAPVVILVWRDERQPEQVAFALYHIAVPYYGIKGAGLSAITETAVHGRPAYWVEGPHRIRLQGGEISEWLFVPGNVLVWTRGDLTYRLEGAGSIEAAVDLAESLAPRRERGP